MKTTADKVWPDLCDCLDRSCLRGPDLFPVDREALLRSIQVVRRTLTFLPGSEYSLGMSSFVSSESTVEVTLVLTESTGHPDPIHCNEIVGKKYAKLTAEQFNAFAFVIASTWG